MCKCVCWLQLITASPDEFEVTHRFLQSFFPPTRLKGDKLPTVIRKLSGKQVPKEIKRLILYKALFKKGYWFCPFVDGCGLTQGEGGRDKGRSILKAGEGNLEKN